MILFYALGGGLGHLSRCLAFLHTLGWEDRDYRVLHSSPRAAEVFEATRLIAPPATSDPATLRLFIDELLEQQSFTEIYVDVFPAGILGELCGWEGQELNLIGRHLKWEAYRKRLTGPLPAFKRVYACEELGSEQLRDLSYRELIPLELRWPAADVPGHLPPHCWLVVHSGSEEEVRALYDYARKLADQQKRSPAWVVAGDAGLDPGAFPGAELRSVYPAWPLFAQAEMVVTAAGFNSMAQMKAMREKHLHLPFFRALDDQAMRKTMANEETSGQ